MMAAERLEQFRRYYTPLVSDSMDRLGIAGGVMDRAIQTMGSDANIKVCGFAFPCRVVPTKEYVEIDKILEMVDAIPPHSIVVVAADTDIDAALWGGMMSTRAQARGAVGAIVNGGVRDMEQIARLQFPVFGTYRCVKDIRRRGYMAAYNTTVTCGGVTVQPNDIIFADANGIVVMPQEHFPQIENELRTAVGEEDATMKGLRDGGSAQKLFEQYKRF